MNERALRKLVRDREQLAKMSPGGTPERPIHVAASSVIDVRVRNLPCAQCEGEYRIAEHRADGPGLRAVDVRCVQCGVARTLWFRLDGVEPN